MARSQLDVDGTLSRSDLGRTFAALADSTRRRAVELLRAGPLRAGELAEALDSTPAGLSRHLRVLRDSGLVSETPAEDDARARVYALQREPFEAVRSWTEEVETFWTGQLASFKAHAEATRGKRPRRRGKP